MTGPRPAPEIPISPPPCWQDVRLPSSRPGIWLAVAFFYLIFVSVVGLFWSDTEFLWGALMVGAIPLTVLPAVYAARRLSDPARLGALRSEFGIGGPEADPGAVERAARKGLAAAHGAPFAAFALLAPIYFLVAILDQGRNSAWDERLDTAFFFLLDGAVCVSAAAAMGTAAAGRRPGWAAFRAVVYSLLFTALRIGLMILVATTILEHSRGEDGPLGSLRRLAYADLVLCGLSALVLGAAALAQLRKRLLPLRLSKPLLPRWPSAGGERRSPLTAEELAGAGLDVSAWSLLKWRFWRDPLLRAERRHLWTGRRVLILWIVLPPVLAVAVAAGPFVTRAFWVLLGSPMGIMGGLALFPFAEGLTELPWACVPLLFMVAVIGGEKQGAVFESMLVTPLTPLRLAAARLLGKSWHLVLALALLGAIRQLVPLPFLGGLGMYPEPWHPAGLASLPFVVANGAAFSLMLAAMGMFFAARQRTLTGAAAGSLAAALGLLLAESLLFSFQRVAMWWRYSDDGLLPYATQVLSRNLSEAIFHLLVAGMFLAGAARHLALRREE